jgi:two-component system alkaline phosphatase synthesis response regulator PhoP/two-component system response regulator ResD
MGDAAQSPAKPFLTRRVSVSKMIKKHTLVVDDDRAIRTLLKILLEDSGYTVDTAQNGWEGLMKLGHADYDLVLLDYLMPGLTGLMVLQHIQERYPFLPVVMLTGHTDCRLEARAIAAGARACLYKPFNWVELKEVLSCSVGTAP